jgi:hypothetical protein
VGAKKLLPEGQNHCPICGKSLDREPAGAPAPAIPAEAPRPMRQERPIEPIPTGLPEFPRPRPPVSPPSAPPPVRRPRHTRQVRAIVAVATFVVVMLVVVWLVKASWQRWNAPPPAEGYVFALRQGGMVAPRPVEKDEWVDASANAVQIADFRVRVDSVRVGPVDLLLRSMKTRSTEKFLIIRLIVHDEGVVAREIHYEPWADLPDAPSKHAPQLSDSQSRTYAQKTFDPLAKVAGRAYDDRPVPGGRPLVEVLVFPATPADIEYLRLSLPAAAFGGAGEFRFQIPGTMIDRPPRVSP